MATEHKPKTQRCELVADILNQESGLVNRMAQMMAKKNHHQFVLFVCLCVSVCVCMCQWVSMCIDVCVCIDVAYIPSISPILTNIPNHIPFFPLKSPFFLPVSRAPKRCRLSLLPRHRAGPAQVTFAVPPTTAGPAVIGNAQGQSLG